MQKVFVVDACRTPIGKTGGSLVDYSDTELMSFAMKSIIKRNSKYPHPQEVIIGCCFPQEHRNLAKKAAVQANFSSHIPAVTINRTCASSMEALIQGFYRIRYGDADTILVGGTENMNRNPHVMKMNIQNVRKYLKNGLPDMPKSLPEEILLDSIGMSVDMSARDFLIDKKEQDEYSIYSHEKAETASKNGKFDSEIVPIEHLNEDRCTSKDEGINANISETDYNEANPLYFKNGTITKYNASSISDGAAAILLMSEQEVRRLSIQPIAEVVSYSLIGSRVESIGTAAADAYLSLIYKNKLRNSDIQLIECNEAYAAQAISCIRKANWETQKVNVNGGSLSIGHPLGCTGVRICTTLLYSMRQTTSNFGVATMCAGGGMGQAILFKLSEGDF